MMPVTQDPPTDNVLPFPQADAMPVRHYTKLWHEYTDEAMYYLSGAAFKVLIFLLRHTEGFQQAQQRLTLVQMSEGVDLRSGAHLKGTGLARKTVILALRELERAHMIDSDATLKGRTAARHYWLPPCEQWDMAALAEADVPATSNKMLPTGATGHILCPASHKMTPRTGNKMTPPKKDRVKYTSERQNPFPDGNEGAADASAVPAVHHVTRDAPTPDAQPQASLVTQRGSPAPRAAAAKPRQPTPTAQPKAPAPRPVNPLWDALWALFPNHRPVTRPERSNWGKIVKDLKEAGAIPAEMRRRLGNYLARYGPDMATPNALVTHWSESDKPPQEPRGERGARGAGPVTPPTRSKLPAASNDWANEYRDQERG